MPRTLSPLIRAFPELSLSPVFQRRWPTAYAAMEQGRQGQEWLESHFMRQVPTAGIQAFALDHTAGPRPAAKTLANRRYVYSPTAAGCDRWTMLVSVAQWELMLARGLVQDHPLPWQHAQEELTPERTLQGPGGLFTAWHTGGGAPDARKAARLAHRPTTDAPEALSGRQERPAEAQTGLKSARN